MKASLPDLELLGAVVRLGNFRRAAAALGLSPSAASERIRALEDRIGARLLNRTTRSVAATEAGLALLRRIEPALAELESALDEAGGTTSEVTGTVRINSPPPATQLVLAPLITGFIADHPKVTFDVTSESGFVDIVRGGYDAGVRWGESLAADMIAVPLGGPLRICMVASPGLIAAVGIPSDPQALLRLPCIQTRYSSGTLPPWEFSKRGRHVTIRPQGPLITTDSALALAAAIAGVGFYPTFEGWAKDALDSGRLVAVLQDWMPPFDGPFLYYPSRRHMPGPLKAFVAYVRTHDSTSRARPRGKAQ